MTRLLKKYFRAEFLMPNILIPMISLALDCVLFIFLINCYLYEVVNYRFSALLLIALLGFFLILIIVHLIFFIVFYVLKNNRFSLNHSRGKFHFSDLFLILLPLTPVTGYILNNLDFLTPLETLKVLIFFLLFSVSYIYIIPFLFGKFGSTKIMSSLGAAFAFTITSMPSLSQEFNWITRGDFLLQTLYFVVTFLLVRLLSNHKTRKFLYIIIMANFLIGIISPFLSKDIGFAEAETTSSIEKSELFSYVNGKNVFLTPNIYMLVYESYVPNETMLGYGIDNSQQEDYLSGQGFKIYPNIYSVGSPTIPSMSRVFNASPSFYGYPRRGISGDGVVHNVLKKIGYKTIGVFPDNFMFQGVGSNYDYSYPEVKEEDLTSDKLLILTILSGEFRFKLGLKDLPPPHDQYIATKNDNFDKIFKDPIFIYSHSDFPGHAEFQSKCRPNEMELFEEDLLRANLEMKNDVNNILENDPNAIIIVAGDHGPYLSNDCFMPLDKDKSEISRFDIQDRFATFLAVRWPTKEFEKYDDIVVLQDLFPVILAYIYEDPKIIDMKIEPEILSTEKINGATVKNGIIFGGINDGESLFLFDN